jgi:hypothetical protein
MAEKQREKIYECHVKRRRRKASGIGLEFFWKIKPVAEALVDEDTEFRCKDCHGEVKLYKKRLDGPASHVEHKHRQDSEYCVGGIYYQAASDGRVPRLSEAPVR